MKHTKVKRKDIEGLSKTAMVELIWTLTKEADMYAEWSVPEDTPRDYCVMTPDQILSHIEEAVGK